MLNGRGLDRVFSAAELLIALLLWKSHLICSKFIQHQVSDLEEPEHDHALPHSSAYATKSNRLFHIALQPKSVFFSHGTLILVLLNIF